MKIKFALSILLASVSVASAADMGASYVKAPPAAPIYKWTGFYLGVLGGYGWQADTTNATAAGGFGDIKGGFGGGTIGYNWMASPNWLLGIEGEAFASNLNQTIGALPVVGAKDSIGSFGSIAARIGYVTGPVLFYGKGGVAIGSNKLELTALGVTISDTRTHLGWVAGGGVEYMFAPSWSLKGEYLYTGYGSENYFSGLLASGNVNFHTVKGGVNYHF